jgi:hypothetical protein
LVRLPTPPFEKTHFPGGPNVDLHAEHFPHTDGSMWLLLPRSQVDPGHKGGR